MTLFFNFLRTVRSLSIIIYFLRHSKSTCVCVCMSAIRFFCEKFWMVSKLVSIVGDRVGSGTDLAGCVLSVFFSSSLRGGEPSSPQALTLFRGVKLIDNADGARGYFWKCRARVGYDPAPGPTLIRPCVILLRLVGRKTNTTTTTCRGGRYSFSLECSILPLIRTLYCWVLSKEVSSIIFTVFGITRSGIELRSPGPLTNTLPTRPMSRCIDVKGAIILYVKSFWHSGNSKNFLCVCASHISDTGVC